MGSRKMGHALVAHTESRGNQNRAFGIVFAIVFFAIGLWPLISGNSPRVWAIGTSSLFLVLAIAIPGSLGPLTKLWLRFGELLHVVMNPLVLGLIYLISVIPVGLLMRLLHKDPLHRRFEPSAKTYWVLRKPSEPQPDSLYRQF